MHPRKIRVEALCRKVRDRANTLSLKKILRLDFGDTALVERMLEDLLLRLDELHRLQEAGCSQLLELLDYLTAKDDNHPPCT
jgi:hypothetical protein